MKSLSLVMESILDSKPHIEREVTCYVRLRDLHDVTSIADSSETHEQWNVSVDSKNTRMRIRLTDGVEPSLTVKERTKKEFETIETEQLIDMSFFNVIKKSLGFNGYNKTRYNIQIEGTDRKWEVDVFKNHRGVPSLWVKLDYEFDAGETNLPEIPFEYVEIMVPDLGDGNDEAVSDLWEKEWRRIDE